jgi:cytochrome c oxidase cbb3-type subunit III
MYSRCRSSLLPAAALACVVAAVGCQREERAFKLPPQSTSPPSQTAMTNLVAGTTDTALRARRTRVYGENAYQLSQGQDLYSAFNCVGCHAHGGGDVGPALMDDKWIYGGEIDQIYLSIAQGRPNGMPAFAGMIPPQQMWQLAGYVRSLGGHGPKSARPGRSDHLRTPSPQEARPVPEVRAARED